MKEKIIQVIPINATFWGSFKTSMMILLTDKGNLYRATSDNTDFERMTDLPKEIQPE